MLINLHVKNMALIREEEVSFGPGLNILTGETGAGKSIIIGSVNIALGTGSFKDYVPEDAQSALVELVFETRDPKALSMLAGAQIPVTDGQVVITRKYQGGRSISRVNGETVTVRFIRELAAHLIDIHGQHEHQSLLYPQFHLELLDRFAAPVLGELPAACEAAFRKWKELKERLEESGLDEQERAKRSDLIAYEIREIDEAAPVSGEDEQLEREFRRLENGQKITSALAEVQALVLEGESASDAVSRGVRALSAVSDYDEGLGDLVQQLAQIEDLMGDFGRDLSGYLDDFSYDEQTFYQIGQRLDLLNHLKTKYGRTIPEVLAYRERQQEELDRLSDYEAYRSRLTAECDQAYRELEGIARKIHQIRETYAKELEQRITQALVELNFLDVRFAIRFTQARQIGPSGMDQICFMISVNPGMPMGALQETASGGELSRIMLAIKSVMADQDAVETLIFDEIDTGISGRTAQKVSERMAVIASSHQVICITHLAQIASMADSHFEIRKELEGGSTQTHIRPLSEKDRVKELARILGGARITQSVLESAEEMLGMAREVKRKKSS